MKNTSSRRRRIETDSIDPESDPACSEATSRGEARNRMRASWVHGDKRAPSIDSR